MFDNQRAFPDLLRERIWHVTSSERYASISKGGFILPDPPIPDSERWCTAAGPDHFPFVRTIGGISLFDFKGFDEDRYEQEYPLSNWSAFVPYQEGWNISVWLEFDRRGLGSRFLDGAELLERWRGARVNNLIMPEIEAAFLGPLSADCVSAVFESGPAIDGFREMSNS